VAVKSQIYAWLMAIGNTIIWKIDALERTGDTIVQIVPLPKAGREYRRLIGKTGPDYTLICRMQPTGLDALLGQIHLAGSVCWVQSSKYGNFHAILEIDSTISLVSAAYVGTGEYEVQLHLLRRDDQFNTNQFNPLEFG
jgi:hypothetical protein